ncbi:MAG: hypothetical protein AB7F86_16365 [Bdellovibrionales bacterium]
MKTNIDRHTGVQELCQRLKDQLEALNEIMAKPDSDLENRQRHSELMEKLKRQLEELSGP